MKASKKAKKDNTAFDMIEDCKRRNNCRLNQIRHRAKQKDHLLALKNRMDQLHEDIQRLTSSNGDFSRLVEYVKDNAAQARYIVVRNWYTLFQFGMKDTIPAQFEFINVRLDREMRLNGEKKGREIFWNQMVLLSTLYSNIQFELGNIDIHGLTNDILHVTAKLFLQLNRNVIQTLYPSLQYQTEMIEFLHGRWMALGIHQIYHFDGQMITNIDTNCNWVDAWRPLCRNYQDVYTILKNANIDQHLFIHENELLAK